MTEYLRPPPTLDDLKGDIAAILESDTIILDSSDQTILELETAPSDPPNNGTVMRSLWQENLRALRAERWFGFELFRADAVAMVSDVDYSNEIGP